MKLNKKEDNLRLLSQIMTGLGLVTIQVINYLQGGQVPKEPEPHLTTDDVFEKIKKH